MIRIAITGPESSGKSDLAKTLAAYFKTTYAQEYARIFLSEKAEPYSFKDLDLICEGQLNEERKAMERAERIVFFDTDMLVLKIWSEYRFGKVSKQIQCAYEEADYDLTLLCKPDLPWAPDPLRESPNQAERDQLFELYKKELEHRKQPFIQIFGLEESRLARAIQAVQLLLDRTT